MTHQVNHDRNDLPYLVYGTLRRNGTNHARLAHMTEYADTFRIYGYEMFTNGAFPYAVPSTKKGASIVVEMYVPREGYERQAMQSLDSLEGFVAPNFSGNHYDRVAIPVPAAPEVLAWMYVGANPAGRCHVIPSGDWNDFDDKPRFVGR